LESQAGLLVWVPDAWSVGFDAFPADGLDGVAFDPAVHAGSASSGFEDHAVVDGEAR